jgi:hypothetical protein
MKRVFNYLERQFDNVFQLAETILAVLIVAGILSCVVFTTEVVNTLNAVGDYLSGNHTTIRKN